MKISLRKITSPRRNEQHFSCDHEHFRVEISRVETSLVETALVETGFDARFAARASCTRNRIK